MCKRRRLPLLSRVVDLVKRAKSYGVRTPLVVGDEHYSLIREDLGTGRHSEVKYNADLELVVREILGETGKGVVKSA